VDGSGRPDSGLPLVIAPLSENGPQHPEAVAYRAQVANPVNARALEAGNLGNNEPSLGDTYIYQRLDLKAVTPQTSVGVGPGWRRGIEAEYRHVPSPEDVESVAEI
jgi:hypothetical protein